MPKKLNRNFIPFKVLSECLKAFGQDTKELTLVRKIHLDPLLKSPAGRFEVEFCDFDLRNVKESIGVTYKDNTIFSLKMKAVQYILQLKIIHSYLSI